jgi:PPK2 family polyphosphate:nucleotide phosphotransferase
MAYAHRVEGKGNLRLSEFDPDENGGMEKEEGLLKVQELGKELTELADLLYFASQQSLLIILQGLDTSGKDGTIRCILEHCNAQGARVESFKVPTEEERAHDFLWRVHSRTPRKGHLTIFNRSHYEDVLVVRVHELVPEKVWKPRYDHINRFEALLADSDTMILKFFLHITKEEQEQRLLDREKETEKSWKLSAGDWREREHWDVYRKAYEDALSECSTKAAPWYVIPANRKWFRNLAVMETIVETLRERQETWMESLEALGKERLEELEAYRAEASGRWPKHPTPTR